MKRILIHLPEELNELVMSYPLLHYINQKYENEKIDLIVIEKLAEYLDILPFDFDVFTYEKDELSSLKECHRFCVNCYQIVNPDIYFSLNRSVVSSFLGFNFRSKERVGFSGGVKSFLFHKKSTPEQSIPKYHQYLDLYATHVKRPLSDLMKTGFISRELKPYFSNWQDERYITICGGSEKKLSIDKIIELMNYFESEKIIFIGFANEKEQIEQLIPKLINKNNYLNYVDRLSPWEQCQVMSYAKGSICIDDGYDQLAAYMSLNTLILHSISDENYSSTAYSKGQIYHASHKDDLGKIADVFHDLFLLPDPQEVEEKLERQMKAEKQLAKSQKR